jgi:L-aspartate oxidase
MKTDFLVIGSGIAGLSFALKVAKEQPKAKIIIITKSLETEGSTKHAQGGIAVVSDFDNDSFENHINDTLLAGDGLCNPEVVNFVVEQAPIRLNELISYGVNFDQDNKQKYDLAKEGGHSQKRIIHKQDCTGLEIVESLLKRIKSYKNIQIINHLFALDLLVENGSCFGVCTQDVNTCEIKKIFAKRTLLATGGIGQIFQFTTNPLVSTADGIAMAKRANVKISDMEFVQFHPTALYSPYQSPSFLISEAVRGKGAILRTVNGKRFMRNYHKDEELATRDIVARAIDIEIKKTIVNYVFLDCSTILDDEFLKYFPNIKSKCERLGLDLNTDSIPVMPAAHFLCGGINTDINGRTNIDNLYACGECANTGLNGANRLASNSLLESLVFSHQCAIDAIAQNSAINLSDIAEVKFSKKEDYSPEKVKKEISRLKGVMTKNVGVFTNNKLLKEAQEFMIIMNKEIKNIQAKYNSSIKIVEWKNLTQVALLIIEQSLDRKENRGVFYNKNLVK